MKNNSFITEKEDIGKRIDVFISEEMELTRSAVQKIIENNGVFVNDKNINKNYKIRQGDIITCEIPEPVNYDILPENIPLDILYEDDDLIVVNKDKGMVVHPAPGHYTGTLVNALMYHCKDNLSGINGVLRPGIVHRIDKDTSGILVIAKNDNAHISLGKQLAEHSVTRVYNAVCHNNFKEDTGTVDKAIGRHPVDRKKMSVNSKVSKRAVTHYKVLERFNKYTFVECRLETGRTHQIRVHMSSISHPLLGDKVYGSDKQPFNLESQVLHAKVLGFIHPGTGKYMEFETRLPNYFRELINKLEKM